jgi:hypothetical protein
MERNGPDVESLQGSQLVGLRKSENRLKQRHFCARFNPVNFMRKGISTAQAIVLGIWLCFGPGAAQAQTCNAPLSDVHYTKYTVAEAGIYYETNATGPVIAASNAYIFAATVNLKTNYTSTFATLAVPDQGPQPMKDENSRIFTVEADATNFAELNAAYPGGYYSFVVSNDYTTVPFPTNAVLPNAPTLSDYVGDQSINPAQNFTLRWNAFSSGQTKDVIDVNVAQESGGSVFQTPAFGCPGGLDGTATSVIIPANTLASNQTYRAEITFVDVLTLDTNSTPFVALLAGTEAETYATIATSAAISGPVLTNFLGLADGSVRFDLATMPGVTYTIQYNSTLNNPAGWTPLLTTDALGNSVSFTNRPSSLDGFYRVRRQ